MALIAFGNAMVDYFFFDDHLLQLSFCLTGATLVSVLSFIWLPSQMACCNFYMFISSVLYVSISGAQVPTQPARRATRAPELGPPRHSPSVAG
jgi:hypothetical protein